MEDLSSHSPSSSAFAMAGVTQEPLQRSWEPVRGPLRGNPLPKLLGAGTWQIVSSHISSEDKDFESSIRKGKCRGWSKDPKRGGGTLHRPPAVLASWGGSPHPGLLAFPRKVLEREVPLEPEGDGAHPPELWK